MNFIDCVLLTLANMAICITLPKLLFLLQAPKNNQIEQLQPQLNPQVSESSAPSFPY